MAWSRSETFAPVGLELLLRAKLRAVVNRVRQAMDESPVKMATTIALMAAIWLGLYLVFIGVFYELQSTPFEAAVAIPMVFSCFFVAMLVMLTISNAILAYMSLFDTQESSYLLSAPLRPRTYVYLKYLETLLFSSWSLVLLGLPLMIAMARITDEPWFFHPLFLGFFICFVPIPGAAGLLLAWVVARFLPRTVRKKVFLAAAFLGAGAVVWFIQSTPVEEEATSRWLNLFLDRMGFIQSALLPSSWVSHGVEGALQARVTEALCYLAVTVANALFLSWVAVRLVSGRFLLAFDRALSSRGSGRRPATEPTGGLAGTVFFYLPAHLRLIAAKDLRTFFRDSLQWTQLLILFGLLALYLINLPRFASDTPLEGWGMIIPFLNLGAISFLLATFTSRFVFPLVSLEGQQFWLIRMLPIPRGRILLAKFAFAMTVCLTVALATMFLAAIVLRLPLAWTMIEVAVIFSFCVGLCGLAVGLGARLPMFNERNAARVANSFGGTVNLIASVGLVLLLLMGMWVVAVRVRSFGFGGALDATTIGIVALICLLGIAAGALALALGARHFKHAET